MELEVHCREWLQPFLETREPAARNLCSVQMPDRSLLNQHLQADQAHTAQLTHRLRLNLQVFQEVSYHHLKEVKVSLA